MVKPSLDIALSSPDITAFKNKMSEASNHTGTVARQIAKQFLDINTGLKDNLMASASRMALGLVAKIALVVGSFKLMGDAIGAARNQLTQMVEIADKAGSTNFSPEFWQSWVNGAKGAEKQVELFENALEQAFQALKPVLKPDWSVWDQGKEKVSAVAKAMGEMRQMFSDTQDSSGFNMFRNAKTQDEQVTAVLTFMKQLQSIGENVAAIDLGEKLFGARWADQLRIGKISVDQLLDDIKTKSVDAFSNETVNRAKALDDELKNAWRTVSQNLHPSLEGLDNLFLDFKSIWVDIVKLLGQAAALWNNLRPASGGGPGTLVKAIDLDQQTRLQNRLNDPGLTPLQKKGYQDQLLAVQSRIAQAEASNVPMAPVNFSYGGESSVPMPKRRPSDAPAPPKSTTTTGGVDKLQSAADSIEKRTAALQAEAAAIDLGTAAREKAKAVAQLETIAKQANAAAGKGENVITAEQRRLIDEVAASYSNVAQAYEKARVASSIKFDRQTSMLDPSDAAIARELKDLYPSVADALGSVEAAAMRTNEAMKGIAGTMSQTLTSGLTDILDGTKSVSDGFASMAKSISRALQEALIKMLVVGPIMRSLSGGLGFADGGMIGDAGSITVGNQSFPKFAEGGPIRGPGTGRSDSIPILASNGEFMVNAEATARHRSLLEAINSGKLPAFADGGIVGSVPAADGGMIGNVGAGVQMNVGGITINGSAGTPQQNDDLVKKMVAAMKDQASALVTKELRQQMRPGGLFKGN